MALTWRIHFCKVLTFWKSDGLENFVPVFATLTTNNLSGDCWNGNFWNPRTLSKFQFWTYSVYKICQAIENSWILLIHVFINKFPNSWLPTIFSILIHNRQLQVIYQKLVTHPFRKCSILLRNILVCSKCLIAPPVLYNIDIHTSLHNGSVLQQNTGWIF